MQPYSQIRCQFTRRSFDEALDVCALLGEHAEVIVSGLNASHVIRYCEKGLLNRVRWVLQVRPDIKPSLSMFRAGCRYGRANLIKALFVEWPHEVVTQFVSFRDACDGGHLLLAQWLLNAVRLLRNQPRVFWLVCPSFIALAIPTAADNGHLEVVRWLLQMNPAARPEDSVLIRVCSAGHLKVAQALLPCYDLQENSGAICGMFRSACAGGHLEILQWMCALPTGLPSAKIGVSGLIAASRFYNREVMRWVYSQYVDLDDSLEIDSSMRSWLCLLQQQHPQQSVSNLKCDLDLFSFAACRARRWRGRRQGVWLSSLLSPRNLLQRVPEDVSRWIIEYV